MRICFITTNFWPEPTGISIYTTDLSLILKKNGHDVTVLTTLPHYPWWYIPEEYSYIVEGEDSYSGVKLLRSGHLIPSKMNIFSRIRFEFSLWWNLRRFSKSLASQKFDLIIACIPSVAAGIIARNLADKKNLPFGLIVQDLSGLGAKQSGMRGGAIIAKFAGAFEGRLLRSAEGVTVVSPEMINTLLDYGITTSKINQILNYSVNNITTVHRNIAREKLGWNQEDFIIIYTGNMGVKQDLKNVIEAANKLKKVSNIKIYLIGHGNQESKLKKLCIGNPNLNILPAVSEKDYPYVLSSANLLLVSERKTQLNMSLPSKLTSYLLSRRPVLASVPYGGATWKYLDGIAELVEAGNPTSLAEKIKELSKNPRRLNELSELGYNFAKENLDAEKGRQKYLDWVNALLKMKSS